MLKIPMIDPAGLQSISRTAHITWWPSISMALIFMRKECNCKYAWVIRRSLCGTDLQSVTITSIVVTRPRQLGLLCKLWIIMHLMVTHLRLNEAYISYSNIVCRPKPTTIILITALWFPWKPEEFCSQFFILAILNAFLTSSLVEIFLRNLNSKILSEPAIKGGKPLNNMVTEIGSFQHA
jgi:hypothetical protein